MKKYYVYEIVNSIGTVEYIGETNNCKLRWNNHKCINGKFNGRNDIILKVVSIFYNRKDALELQYKLQKQYGFETDLDKCKKNSLSGGFKKKIGKRPVNAYDYKTKMFICYFPSTRNAEKVLNISNIDKNLKGEYKQVGGYYFEYNNQ
jgi:predicted GIY-YIG superfamily endonuclease